MSGHPRKLAGWGPHGPAAPCPCSKLTPMFAQAKAEALFPCEVSVSRRPQRPISGARPSAPAPGLLYIYTEAIPTCLFPLDSSSPLPDHPSGIWSPAV